MRDSTTPGIRAMLSPKAKSTGIRERKKKKESKQINRSLHASQLERLYIIERLDNYNTLVVLSWTHTHRVMP